MVADSDNNNSQKLFIHIGLHKTGTTYLQTLVFPDMSIYYSPEVSRELRRCVEESCGHSAPKKVYIEKIRDYINECSGPVLLSHESIMGHFRDRYHDFEDNVKFLHDHFPQAEIIIVTRNHDEWQRSLYKEAVYTQSETRSFDSFKFKFDSTEAIKFLNRYFVTHVIEYELLANDHDSFVRTLEEITNSTFFGTKGNPIRTSLSSFQLQVVRVANLIGSSKKTNSVIKRIIPF